MVARTLPNLGLKAFFDVGEDGWDDEMSLNLLTLSVLTQGTVLSKVAATPGSPTNGDVHILDETHATEPNKIAIRDAGAWVYVAPTEGWLVYNRAMNYYERFNGTVWAELATGGGGGGGALDDLSDVDTTTVAPTDGQALVYDAGTSTWKPGTVAGGGGGAVSYERARVEPAVADFTLLNAGTATAVDGTNGIVLTAPSPGSTQIRFLAANGALPAAPFEVITRSSPISPIQGTGHYSQCLILRNSTTGAIAIAGYYDRQLLAQVWSNYTTYSSAMFGPSAVADIPPWHKVEVTATDMIFSVSPDGIEWFEYLNTAISGTIGAVDEVGFGAFVNSGGTKDLLESFEFV